MKPDLPSPDGFWILSAGFRDAGDSTLTMIRTGTYIGFAVMPCVFLYFRSIELALKAVLVQHAVPEHEIRGRGLGHRISALMSRAETFTLLSTLGIQPEDRKFLDRFSEAYSEKSFEYSDDWWQHPHLEDLKKLAHRVCSAVQTYGKGEASQASNFE
jgi:hypothetical protein